MRARRLWIITICIKTKIPQTLCILRICGIFLNERAGIRTPDNLIKIQVLKVPRTPSFRRFLDLPWTFFGHYDFIDFIGRIQIAQKHHLRRIRAFSGSPVFSHFCYRLSSQ